MTIVTATIDSGSAAIPKFAALVGVVGSTTYTLATTAALTANGSVAGIALEAGAPGAAISMQVDGTVTGAMAAGDYAAVVADASGKLARAATWTDSSFGVVSTTGDVTILTSSSSASTTNLKPLGVFNVKDFGAKGDNTTDDLPAFTSCMVASKFINTGKARGARIIIDAAADKYYLNGDWHIDSLNVIVEGTGGGGGNGASQLRFSKGHGIIQDSNALDATQDGQFCLLRNFDIYGGGLVTLKGDGVWHAGMSVTAGDLILPTSSYRLTLIALNSGTTGVGAEPAWNLSYPNVTQSFLDGTVQWKTVSYAAITSNNRIFCEHLYINGFTNAGICALGNLLLSPPTYSSGTSIRYCVIRNTGTGITAGGGDGSAGSCIGCDIQACGNTGNGYPVGGSGGIGLDDSSFLGWHWFGCQVAAVQGPGAKTTTNTQMSTMVGCYIEGDCQQPVWNGSVISGTMGANAPVDATCVSANFGSQHIYIDDKRVTPLRLALDLQDGHSFLMLRNDPVGGQRYVWYHDSSVGEWYQQWGAQNARQLIGLTTAIAGGSGVTSLGAGNWIDYLGHWCGAGTKYFLGCDATSETDANVALGTRPVGFRLETANAAPLTGTSIGKIVTSAGFTGQARTNGMTAQNGYAPWGLPATQIVVSGNAYVCTVSGTAAGSPPAFDSTPTHTTIDGTITWTCLGVVPSYSQYGKIYNAGTLTISTAGAYALTAYQAAYECIEATGAAAAITVTTSYDGQVICVYNASGGNITVVGFTVTNGQMITAKFVGGGTNAWKKQSLV